MHADGLTLMVIGKYVITISEMTPGALSLIVAQSHTWQLTIKIVCHAVL